MARRDYLFGFKSDYKNPSLKNLIFIQFHSLNIIDLGRKVWSAEPSGKGKLFCTEHPKLRYSLCDVACVWDEKRVPSSVCWRLCPALPHGVAGCLLWTDREQSINLSLMNGFSQRDLGGCSFPVPQSTGIKWLIKTLLNGQLSFYELKVSPSGLSKRLLQRLGAIFDTSRLSLWLPAVSVLHAILMRT